MRISPLRQRMTGDMTARHFGEKARISDGPGLPRQKPQYESAAYDVC